MEVETQRKGHMKIREEGSPLQTVGRGLWRPQPCQNLDRGLPVSILSRGGFQVFELLNLWNTIATFLRSNLISLTNVY